VEVAMSDRAELARLMEEHRPKLLRMLENRIDASLRRRIDPEDVLAEAYLKASARWEDYQSSRPISEYPWLYQQTLDSLVAAWRRYDGAGRDAKREMPWPEHSSAALGMGLLGSGTTPSRAVHRNEMAEAVKAALERLKPSHREILLMRHFDDLPFKEAAEVLGIERNAAEQRYVRALLRLKKELAVAGLGSEEL
jgi:RNA polymerase sigma-70 factor (ECF subfamily)